jgi:hypothetical protein
MIRRRGESQKYIVWPSGLKRGVLIEACEWRLEILAQRPEYEIAGPIGAPVVDPRGQAEFNVHEPRHVECVTWRVVEIGERHSFREPQQQLS